MGFCDESDIEKLESLSVVMIAVCFNIFLMLFMILVSTRKKSKKTFDPRIFIQDTGHRIVRLVKILPKI